MIAGGYEREYRASGGGSGLKGVEKGKRKRRWVLEVEDVGGLARRGWRGDQVRRHWILFRGGWNNRPISDLIENLSSSARGDCQPSSLRPFVPVEVASKEEIISAPQPRPTLLPTSQFSFSPVELYSCDIFFFSSSSSFFISICSFVRSFVRSSVRWVGWLVGRFVLLSRELLSAILKHRFLLQRFSRGFFRIQTFDGWWTNFYSSYTSILCTSLTPCTLHDLLTTWLFSFLDRSKREWSIKLARKKNQTQQWRTISTGWRWIVGWTESKPDFPYVQFPSRCNNYVSRSRGRS